MIKTKWEVSEFLRETFPASIVFTTGAVAIAAPIAESAYKAR